SAAAVSGTEREGFSRALDMRILEASDKRAVARLLAAATGRAHASAGRVRDLAPAACALRFDNLTGSLEVTEATMRAEAARVDPAVRRALKQAARNIARVAFKQIPRHFDLDIAAGVS